MSAFAIPHLAIRTRGRWREVGVLLPSHSGPIRPAELAFGRRHVATDRVFACICQSEADDIPPGHLPWCQWSDPEYQGGCPF